MLIEYIITIKPAEPRPPFPFRNHYRCPYDGTMWRDEWTCTCNDKCHVCNAEIEPHFSEDIEATD